MPTFREPDDVDFIVAGGDSSPESIQETIEFIRRDKARPGYEEEVAESKRLLESIGIDTVTYGLPDPQVTLERLKQIQEDARRMVREEAKGGPSPEADAARSASAG